MKIKSPLLRLIFAKQLGESEEEKNLVSQYQTELKQVMAEFKAAQTNEDMQYYLHTRFPELEKDISVKLAEFETKLNNEGFVHKDQYDEDLHRFDCAISDNMNDFDKRLDAVADDNGGLWNKMDEIQHDLNRIEQNVQCIDITLKHVQRTYIPKPSDIRDDVYLTEITVGDDPNQMSKGTTV